mgnify:CR=1 FL=1
MFWLNILFYNLQASGKKGRDKTVIKVAKDSLIGN